MSPWGFLLWYNDLLQKTTVLLHVPSSLKLTKLCSTLPSSIHLYLKRIKIYYVFSVSYKSVAFLWILTHWYHRDLSFNICIILTSPVVKRREIPFSHSNCNISIIKPCAILGLTSFAIHYCPHIWFCITYICLFLIWHLNMLYSLLFVILYLVHYK